MILTCPRCATRYLVEEDEVRATGRTVRCSACGEEWRVYPPGVEPPVLAGEAVASPTQFASESGGGLEVEAMEAAEPLEPLEPPAHAEPQAEAWPPLFATAPAVEAVATELRLAPQEPPAPAAEPAPEAWTPAAARGEEPSMVAPIATGRASRARRGSGAGIVLIVMLVVLALLAAVFVGARAQLVRAVPAMEGVYKTLGLPVAPPGG